MTIHYISDLDFDDLEPDQLSRVIKNPEQFIQKSRKTWKALKKLADPLSQTRLGKVNAKPLSKKLRECLQSIPKDTISVYLKDRKLDLRP
jgi:hypothetical protein